MCFSERRARLPRHRGAYAGAGAAGISAAIVSLLIATGPAAAAPLDEPLVGGLSFTGPTSANLGPSTGIRPRSGWSAASS
jgi:hypothetical protein